MESLEEISLEGIEIRDFSMLLDSIRGKIHKNVDKIFPEFVKAINSLPTPHHRQIIRAAIGISIENSYNKGMSYALHPDFNEDIFDILEKNSVFVRDSLSQYEDLCHKLEEYVLKKVERAIDYGSLMGYYEGMRDVLFWIKKYGGGFVENLILEKGEFKAASVA